MINSPAASHRQRHCIVVSQVGVGGGGGGDDGVDSGVGLGGGGGEVSMVCDKI